MASKMNRKRIKRLKDITENIFVDQHLYMDAKRAKLMHQYDQQVRDCTEKVSDIFKGVAILVNGLTRPSAEELKLIMAKHGGVFHLYQVSSTTHIIASNLPNTKLKHLGSVPIVKPQWITESLEMQKLLDYKRYLLYTNQSVTQPKLQFPVVPKPTASSDKSSELSIPSAELYYKENYCNSTKETPSFDNSSTPSSFETENHISTDSEINSTSSDVIIDSGNTELCELRSLQCDSDHKNNVTSVPSTTNQNNVPSAANLNLVLSEKTTSITSLGNVSSPTNLNSVMSVDIPNFTNQCTVPSATNLSLVPSVNKPSITSQSNILSATNSSLASSVHKASITNQNNIPSVTNSSLASSVHKASITNQSNIPSVTNLRLLSSVHEPSITNQSNIPSVTNLRLVSSVHKPSITDQSNIPNATNLSSVLSVHKPSIVSQGYIPSATNLSLISPLHKPSIVNQSSVPHATNINLVSSVDEPSVTKQSIINDKNQISNVAPKSATNIGVAKTAADPSFLKEFYNHSRLHLISTLGAEFKKFVNDLRESSDGKFPGLEKLKGSREKHPNANLHRSHDRIIMHIDMDCFFVSVGLRSRPHLRGKPVAVTHGHTGYVKSNVNREAEIELRREHSNPEAAERFNQMDMNSSMSEVASCSYEARKCGIKNGMFLGTAMRLCPDLQTIPYYFEDYKEVSTTLYKTVASYTLDIEAVSCDEMYVDVSKILEASGLLVEEWATHIRTEIMEKTKCPCSAGFGSNRLQARLATKKAKPAGQFYLTADDIETYMHDIPLSEIPGVGYATLSKLKNLGLNTCGDIQMCSMAMLKSELGQKNGETLYQQAKGIDTRPLNFNHQRKTVSTEVNYGIRFKSLEEAYNFLRSLSHEVYDRLVATNMKAKCVTLKLMIRSPEAPVETAKYLGHGICDTVSKSTTATSFLTSGDVVFREVKSLYEKLKVSFVDLRGIGIHLTKLERNKPAAKSLLNFCQPIGLIKNNDIPKSETEIFTKNITNIQTDDKKLSSKVSSSNTVVQKRGRPRGTKSKSVSKHPVKLDKKPVYLVKKAVNFEAKPVKFERQPSFTSKSYAEAIDMDVLKELPEEMQREILKEYSLQNTNKKEDNSRYPQPLMEPCCSKNISKEANLVLKSIKSKDSSVKSPFHKVGWDELKSLVRNWMQSEKEPTQTDTKMLSDYCKELAQLRKIEYLKMLTNFLHRTLSTENCKWHKAYFTIVNTAQEGMVARYGSTLLVERSYKCCRNN